MLLMFDKSLKGQIHIPNNIPIYTEFPSIVIVSMSAPFQVVSPFVDSGGEPKNSSPKVGFEGNFGRFSLDLNVALFKDGG